MNVNNLFIEKSRSILSNYIIYIYKNKKSNFGFSLIYSRVFVQYIETYLFILLYRCIYIYIYTRGI